VREKETPWVNYRGKLQLAGLVGGIGYTGPPAGDILRGERSGD